MGNARILIARPIWIYLLLSKHYFILEEKVRWTIKSMYKSHIGNNKEFPKLKMSASFTQIQEY